MQTACASGVPFAGIGMQMEQKLNIEECVDFGNALAFTMHDIRRNRTPSPVERLLTDATLRRRARELAAPTRGINGAWHSTDSLKPHPAPPHRPGKAPDPLMQNPGAPCT